ncbi:MAG: Lrp/AsnC family transcriptional regulator [Pseudomonadales bacterium]
MAPGILPPFCPTLLLNRDALGLSFCSFVHVSMSRHIAKNVKSFEEAVLAQPEVLECHATTGDSDFMLKVVTENIDSYNRFLESFLMLQPGIDQVKSNIMPREIKNDSELPVLSEN